jgi:hypothetical protein
MTPAILQAFLHTQERELLQMLRDALNPERKADAGD